MILKHRELDIPPENPFANCKLKRYRYAQALTDIVTNYSDGFVLAINNEWGTGKTTFVKMWKQYLHNQGFETLYFNAWENDFENGALAALMAELSTLQDESTKEIFKKVLKTGAKLAKSAIPILLKAAAAKYLDKDELKDLLAEVTDSANELLHIQIEEYTTKKKGLVEFKESLSTYIRETSGEKPIVFIIDELDRCRPDYAVEVLEKVKHFFDVPGIVFVLSIDKTQLGHAVRGHYGSEKIAAEEYLRRFIDIEYSIPEPEITEWVEYLFEYFGFLEFYENIPKRNSQEEYDAFRKILKYLFIKQRLSLRMHEKIFAQASIAFKTFGRSQVIPAVFIFLIYIKTYHEELYKSIRNVELTPQQLLDSIEELLKNFISDDVRHHFLNMEAQLITLYDNTFIRKTQKSGIYKSEGGEIKYIVKTRFEGPVNYKLHDLLKHINERSEYFSTPIEYLIGKIDLTERIKL
ncbi:hypothetical protein D1614_19080 [Maribellus luteus]|uniref:KAP NTPase domain-containing protein n=1 Tax=Maribellus luteus TaxID=2305463 RepID=A0A399SRB3_9BACT|nr:P-loop NTPase fold protein [Maribellus luteus]RIJ46310.1 hypothetical protein D1614_19080 [Maribellus luteus]